ncbi:hypothetical protein COCSADRAFT_150761 [Bipolaris sorokiniana ND90Pr]|uniref:Uncharacterized protein n=1 Tax=Cochliobolus sativus (strain ND90Pr / ATCC 201652) TaxID=665912 RepID=M2SUZ9_COCSN|nr:uncharacterized protein COCSADRAFT_150761 [Bipolaris sorokiniana ND90Pr]EMD60637.1 hypothetical protein COCSADRAFT_150761 [Bipolaris sorokiniana ND90Pr]
MSNGRAFWAAGKHIVTTPNSPTPSSVETPNKSNNKSPTHQKNKLKVSWADEEEDEKFLALLAPQKDNPTASSLETTITVKDERIKELEATIVSKDLRIAELEVAAQGSHKQIEDLEEDIRVKENTMKTLEKENHTQFIKLQELHRDSTEKDDRVQSQKSALERFTATQDPHQTSILDTQLSTKSGDANGIETVKTNTKESTPTTPKKSGNVQTSELKQSVYKVAEPIATENTKGDQTEKTVGGPSSHDTDSLTFVTKDTLKVVPPAPKPRILTFPIDLSKYGKTPVAALPPKSSGQSPVSMGGKKGHTTSWGQSPKHTRVKTDAKPDFNPSTDIRHMSYASRVLYFNGPDVAVKLGDVELKTLPQYILIQCSGKAWQHFEANPDATSWTLPAGSIDADAARCLLNWMDEMTYQARVYSVTLNSAPVNDQKNVQICRAARVMGLNNTYVGHFTKHLCEKIRSKDTSHKFMNLVCEAAYPENDPVFDCLANKLAMQKAAGSVQCREVLEKLAAAHPALEAEVEKIERRMGTIRGRK